MNKFCASDRLYHALVLLAGIEIIGREKLVNGEGYAAEHRARIILGRAYALLLGQAVVVCRDEQLRAALKPDDRKLAERNIDMARAAGNGYLLAEGVEYLLRNISLIYAGVGQRRFRKGHVQSNRVNGIDLGNGMLFAPSRMQQSSEEKLLTLPSEPNSITRLSNTASPVKH